MAEEKPMSESDESMGGAEVEGMDEEEGVPAKLRMQRDQERRKYAKLEQSYKALANKVGEWERKARISDRKSDLLSLESEGISFDMAEEVDLVQDMNPAKYEKHLAHMRKRYQRAPVNVSIKPLALPMDGSITNNKIETPADVYARVEKLLAERNK